MHQPILSDAELLNGIDTALARVAPMARQSFPPAESIERQLIWCRKTLLKQPSEEMPGPFSMELIAIREFDMYGDDPALAALISKVQRAMEARLSNAQQPNAPFDAHAARGST